MSIEKENYNIIANDIIDKFIKRISGTDVDEFLIGSSPDERVMAGKLGAKRVERKFDGSYTENKESRFESIPSISLTFILDRKSKGNIKIYPTGTLYYRVAPTFEQFETYVLQEYSEKHNTIFSSLQEVLKWMEVSDLNDDIKLPKIYKKIEIDKILEDGLSISIENLIKEQSLSLKNDIDPRMNYFCNEFINDSIVALNRTFQLKSISTEIEFLKSVNSMEIDKSCPNWNFDIRLESSEIESGYRVTITFVNLTEKNDKLGESFSCSIFNTKLKIKGDKEVIFNDIELDYFHNDYKNNVVVKAIPENCSCDYDEEENTIITEHIPIYIQKRLITKDKYNKNTSFNSLISNPIENLVYILNEMKIDFNNLKVVEYKKIKEQNSEDMFLEFNRDIELYNEEINRFESGIKLIQNNKIIYDAFKYMNLTFQKKLNSKSKTVEGWRLFQIVFIVSMINDLISNDNRKKNDKAELLYFPTGGGKTEAFLGIVVFTMFFDRLRNKDIGVSAFIKYPLRLLSINQLERVLSVIIKAETIKKDNNVGGADFSVGYYVGGDNTPNKIKNIDKFLGVSQDVLNEEYRIIDTCPVCGEKSINIHFLEANWRLVHLCDNVKCSQKILPLYIVDNEIYRYLPTVIVSTVDKLSLIGTKSEFKMLFGQVKKYCSTHGYTHNDRCIESYSANCTEKLSDIKNLKDPIPTLFIQDELHLVRESLGTFASHYISFIDYFSRELVPVEHRKNIKFVGATATISMYKNHLWNLYHKDARRFPAAYPTSNKSGDFYSEIDKNDITRIIIGYAPYGRSVTDGVWQSTLIFREILGKLIKYSKKNYENILLKGFNGTEDEYRIILNDYWISINYNNTKQDSLELFNAFQNQANNYLLNKKINKFNIDKMTGDDTFQDVRRILFDIQATKDKSECTNLILATSTISHGVDEDSFNQMYFFGMPNNNAEYIQAYSRVGRKYTGIVIDIIRLMRERDRSYLKNFKLFHENKDYLVEPVPINRWAKNAIFSTCPGILNAYFLQRINPLEKAKDVKNAILNGDLEEEEVINILSKAYGCNSREKMSNAYIDAITDEVKAIFDGFKNDMHGMSYASEKISLYSIGNKKPMISLRDTEEQVIISLK